MASSSGWSCVESFLAMTVSWSSQTGACASCTQVTFACCSAGTITWAFTGHQPLPGLGWVSQGCCCFQTPPQNGAGPGAWQQHQALPVVFENIPPPLLCLFGAQGNEKGCWKCLQWALSHSHCCPHPCEIKAFAEVSCSSSTPSPQKGKEADADFKPALTPGLTHRLRAGFGYFVNVWGVCIPCVPPGQRSSSWEWFLPALSTVVFSEQPLLPRGSRALAYLVLAHFVGRELCQHRGIPAGHSGLGWFPSATHTAQLPALPGQPLGVLFSCVLCSAQNLMIALCAGCQ